MHNGFLLDDAEVLVRRVVRGLGFVLGEAVGLRSGRAADAMAAATLSWIEGNFNLQCKASTAMVWAQLLPLWRKLFAVAVEGDLLGEDATAHVRQNADGIIWIDSAGGEDDAVEAAFF